MEGGTRSGIDIDGVVGIYVPGLCANDSGIALFIIEYSMIDLSATTFSAVLK
jgi:hypothetical protein